MTPNTAQADEPSGYEVQLHVPQSEDPRGLATAQLQNASVTLPAGTSLSLAATNGLSGCEEAQVTLSSSKPATCANSSKIGLVKIRTPLLSHPLEGAIFLATPNANPLGALVALYVVAEDPVSGVMVKLAGQMSLNPSTGQPTLTFDGLPQLPIGEISLYLFGGERSLLANPPACGPAASTGELAPWSAGQEVMVSSSFEVNWEDGGGRTCPDPLPFEPMLRATETAQSGSGSSLTLAISRESLQQNLSRFTVQLPTGVAWMFSSMPLCGEPQAGQGTCPQASQIGGAIIGMDPRSLAWFTGPVYLTGPYEGSQYGLSIALNAVAGPFDFGQLVLRAAIAPNQSTGTLTITTDPLPKILDGIPLRTRAFEMDIDRPEFVLNPTNCASRQTTATIEGSQGTSTQISAPFTVEGCQNPPVPAAFTGAVSGAKDSTPKRSGKNSISHIHERVIGDHLLLSFTTSTGGTVTISGHGVRRYTKKMRAGAHRVKLTLSRTGVTDARRHRPIELHLALAAVDGGTVDTGVTYRL